MGSESSRSEYRSPASAEPDGFFAREGESLPLSGRADDYAPGDLVTWDLGGAFPILVSSWTKNPRRAAVT
jgi:uncharacterized protein YijF (DUF1287 family)